MPSLRARSSRRANRDPVFRKTVPEHEQDNFIAIAGAAQDILSVFVPSLGYLVTVSGNVYSVVL